MAGLSDFDGAVLAVLAHLGIPNARLMGQGGEGRVYEYRDDQVVKIYGGGSVEDLERLTAFQALLPRQGLPFRTPQILEIGHLDETVFTIEQRLLGEMLAGRFAALSPDEQRQALTHYFAAAEAIGSVELADYPYGHVLPVRDEAREAITAPSWGVFLARQIERCLQKAGADLTHDVSALADKTRELLRLVHTRLHNAPKRLVHADYFLGNVLFDRDRRVSAVLDFGVHTLAGDPRLDIAGAIAFLTLDPTVGPWHVEYVAALAEQRHGRGVQAIVDLYTLYNSVYYADTKMDNPDTYAWCVRNLMDARLWQSAQQCGKETVGHDAPG